MKNRKAKKGFTIIELVIVIAVIGILAAVLIPTFSNVIDKANATAAMEEARNAYTQYLVENAENGSIPANICIKSGDYYFVVVGGQFDSKAYDHASLPALTGGAAYTHMNVTTSGTLEAGTHN